MKTVALISGGKDSCYNMMQCVAEGHDIVALANLQPREKDELDSYMYQTVGHHAVELYAEAMDRPLYRRRIQGSSIVTSRDYSPHSLDEVEDLYELLKEVKEQCDIEAVSVGAILSDYQRVRVENVCSRLGLTSLSYLWRRNQQELLQEMIQCGVSAIVIKVAALGLYPDKHLNKTIAEIYPHMLMMQEKYGLNVCGEGGEYETFTLDCPLFNKKIVIDEVESVLHSDDAFAPVGYLNLKRTHLEDKAVDKNTTLLERVQHLSMMHSGQIISQLFTDDEIRCFQAAHIDLPVKTMAQVGEGSNLGEDPLIRPLPSGLTWVTGITSRADEEKSVADLMTDAMRRLRDSLQSFAEMRNVLIVYLYVRQMSDFTAINEAYKKFFSLNPPARVCVEAALPANVHLQLDCVVGQSSTDSGERQAMHVQSLSHWAPANIGPYSQAVKFGELVFVAGQIALIPASLTIIPGGIVPESRLSLRHVQRVVEVMCPGCSLNVVVAVICYVTRAESILTAKAEWLQAVRRCQDDNLGVEPIQDNAVMEIVIVPRLPRCALVEWQVYAHTSREKRAYYTDTVSDGVHQVNIQSTLCVGNPQCLSVMAGLELLPSNSDFVLRDGVAAVMAAYQHNLQRLNMTWNDAPGLRIFYKVTAIEHDLLHTEIQSWLRTQSVDGVPMSAVPVIGFASERKLLSICH